MEEWNILLDWDSESRGLDRGLTRFNTDFSNTMNTFERRIANYRAPEVAGRGLLDRVMSGASAGLFSMAFRKGFKKNDMPITVRKTNYKADESIDFKFKPLTVKAFKEINRNRVVLSDASLKFDRARAGKVQSLNQQTMPVPVIKPVVLPKTIELPKPIPIAAEDFSLFKIKMKLKEDKVLETSGVLLPKPIPIVAEDFSLIKIKMKMKNDKVLETSGVLLPTGQARSQSQLFDYNSTYNPPTGENILNLTMEKVKMELQNRLDSLNNNEKGRVK